ncbi:hypothetical protein HZA33_02510 [Candidatus Pacearchaeota archaeon]|nr:hypothetical protein [Candidatus Pacearchaeota archaeon]
MTKSIPQELYQDLFEGNILSYVGIEEENQTKEMKSLGKSIVDLLYNISKGFPADAKTAELKMNPDSRRYSPKLIQRLDVFYNEFTPLVDKVIKLYESQKIDKITDRIDATRVAINLRNLGTVRAIGGNPNYSFQSYIGMIALREKVMKPLEF